MDHGEQLYRRYLGGDDGAVEELIGLYKDGLMLYLNRYTDNIFTAEELMEETFVRLVTRRPRFFGRSGFKTWLYAIARNLAMDHLRKNARMSDLSAEDLGRIEDAETDLEREYLKQEQALVLCAALKKLNPDYSRVLYLIYFEDFSNAEVAKVLGKTRRQVENLSYRAKLALRKQLEQEEFDYEGF